MTEINEEYQAGTETKKRDKTDPRHVYDLVRRTTWPITYKSVMPVLLEGSDTLDRPYNMRLKDNIWASVDAHCKALGVTKSEWVREAIFRQLYEEQQWFDRNGKDGSEDEQGK